MSTGKKRLLAYLVMILSLVISIKLVKDIIKLKSADKRLIDAGVELLVVQQEQEELKKQLAEAEGRSWWEKQVRNVLKMAKPGEVVVMVPEEVVKEAVQVEEAVKAAEDENYSNFQKWRQVLVD
ncbi:septum formation initiator family protein [Patescibacteria group bacterium]|nr:septum formation initiator family protein [Patescibacteria group bacterium]